MTVARLAYAVSIGAFAVICMPASASPMPQWWPKQGPVSTAAAAIEVAVKLWSPIYGAQHIARERPYHASLEHGVWTVQGSVPRGAVGGAAILKIRRSDGEVLFLSHYK